jgi:hypothetical protein
VSVVSEAHDHGPQPVPRYLDRLNGRDKAARVVRRGGMVGIFDGDYASLTFGHADPVRGKANDETLISAVVTSPRVMRQMPRLLRDAGLELVASLPYVVAEVGKRDFWLSGIASFQRLMPKAGAMTEAEANGWADALRADSEAGVFFGASNYYKLRCQASLGLVRQ